MKKVLFIASHRLNRAPGQRFRFEQYFSFLELNGFKCELSFLISKNDDSIFYSRGNYLKKVLIGMKAIVHRIQDLLSINQYDIIFIFREALMTKSIFFEKRFKTSRAKLIFDFDDAIWIDVISNHNKFFYWLKDARKTQKIIQLSDLIFAGNQYLASYAKQFNANVAIIPTTIDTDTYIPSYRVDKKIITIGWSGSVSTIEHFEHAIPALLEIKKKYRERIAIQVIGDQNYKNDKLHIQGRAWHSETELSDLQTFDIGLMPLPNNEWAKGKCGLKGLQFMALEIPTIMSPIGVNNEIIEHGANGFLGDSTEEWVELISRLIDDPLLRVRIGREGRKTVIKRYSVISQQATYLKFFQSLVNKS